MSTKNTTLTHLPAVILEDVKRDSSEPTRKDYEIQVGGQSRDFAKAGVEHYTLLTIERGAMGRNHETIMEINLDSDQARLMAIKLIEGADHNDALLVDPYHQPRRSHSDGAEHTADELRGRVVARWQAEAAALGLPINQALLDALSAPSTH